MRIGKRLLCLCLLFFPGEFCVYASPIPESAAPLFAQGNSDYQKGDFASAERNYRRIVDSGIDSGSVYYNLGNACFKQKRLGEAIYYWEKAQQMMPGDREIRENLDLANLLLVDRIEVPTDPLTLQILARFTGLFSIVQESWLVLILFFAANVLFSIYLLASNTRRAFVALMSCFGFTLLFMIFTCSLSWKIYKQHYRKEGVVIEQKVDVRSGPGIENITVFTIHEGIKVRVYESSNGWYQVGLPNGWNGWLKQNDVRIL